MDNAMSYDRDNDIYNKIIKFRENDGYFASCQLICRKTDYTDGGHRLDIGYIVCLYYKGWGASTRLFNADETFFDMFNYLDEKISYEKMNEYVNNSTKGWEDAYKEYFKEVLDMEVLRNTAKINKKEGKKRVM